MGDSPMMVELSKLLYPDNAEEDDLRAFLATFPTQLQYMKPPSYLKNNIILWVFWSQQEGGGGGGGSQNNPSSGELEIHEKIKSSFFEFDLTLYDFDGLIQFWAPVSTGGRRLLTTSDQPFAVNHLNTGLDKLRLWSLGYRYHVDVDKHHDAEEDPMIISGAPASAFLNHLPEIVLDLEAHQGCPLVRSALECDLIAHMVLPVSDSSQSCCVGVVECFLKHSHIYFAIFNHLKQALAKVGLRTFDVREYLPYKSIPGLERAQKDIDEALKVVCESHNIDFAQVWIPYEDEKHVGFSSKQTFALKLTGFKNECLGLSYSHYYDACNMFALRIGEGLSGKTLQNHEPHFCRDISKLDNTGLLVSSIYDTKCSCFGICLRSIDTSHDFYYVLEFLWPMSRDYAILLESLVLTLERRLPNFKLASGLQLGDELRIVDVENSTGSDMVYLKFLQGNKLQKPLKKRRTRKIVDRVARSEARNKTARIDIPLEKIQQQFGKTRKEAAIVLKVGESTLVRRCKEYRIFEWPGPQFVQRKINDSHKDQSDMTEVESEAIVDSSAVKGDTYFDDTFTFKAKYDGNMIKFHLPLLLATFVALDKEIGKKFELNCGSFKLEYLDEDEDWILLASEEDMKVCIKNLKSATIRLRVLPCAQNKYPA